MTRLASFETLADLIKIHDESFIPGSTFSPESIAQDCGVRLSLPVLPSDTMVDIDEICQKPSTVQILTTPDLLAA